MTTITIQFKRRFEYSTLDDKFIEELRKQIESSNRESHLEELSFTIKEEFEDWAKEKKSQNQKNILKDQNGVGWLHDGRTNYIYQFR